MGNKCEFRKVNTEDSTGIKGEFTKQFNLLDEQEIHCSNQAKSTVVNKSGGGFVYGKRKLKVCNEHAKYLVEEEDWEYDD